MEASCVDSDNEPFSPDSSDNYEPDSNENASSSSDDANDEAAANQNELRTTPKRQKKRCPEMWKRNIRKKKLASGEEHVNSVKKLVPARTTGPDCKCSKMCFTKVNLEKRQTILKRFNELGEKSAQDHYLAGLITSTVPARSRARDGTRKAKSASNKYKVNIVLVFFICTLTFLLF